VNALTREESERRRRGLRLHIIWAMGILALLIAINAFTRSAYPWWMWVLIAWMPLIAAHAAWAMGLFGRGRREGSGT
jgi:uncharacterized membrane protein YdbT with pleckstrin-like domain